MGKSKFVIGEKFNNIFKVLCMLLSVKVLMNIKHMDSKGNNVYLVVGVQNTIDKKLRSI